MKKSTVKQLLAPAKAVEGIDIDSIVDSIFTMYETGINAVKDKLTTAETKIGELRDEIKDREDDLQAALSNDNDSEEVTKLKGQLKKAETAKETAETAIKTLQGEFDTYKTTIENKEAVAAKKSALLDQLKADGADAKMADLLSSKFDIDKMELEDGKVKGWDELSKGVKAEYAEVFSVADGNPLNVGNPPPPGSKIDMDTLKNMTPEQINKEWDTVSGVLEAKK